MLRVTLTGYSGAQNMNSPGKMWIQWIALYYPLKKWFPRVIQTFDFLRRWYLILLLSWRQHIAVKCIYSLSMSIRQCKQHISELAKNQRIFCVWYKVEIWTDISLNNSLWTSVKFESLLSSSNISIMQNISNFTVTNLILSGNRNVRGCCTSVKA